jgi:hypothetical protein
MNIKHDNAVQEERLRRTRLLARALVDAGFRTLAAKLHPDKAGFSETMAYLNEAYRVMKLATTEKLSLLTFGKPRRECLTCGHYFERGQRKCRSAECVKRIAV